MRIQRMPTTPSLTRVYPAARPATLTALIFVLALLMACTEGGEQTDEMGIRIVADTSQTTGSGIFAANCAVCHGADGGGQHDWHIPSDEGILPPSPLNGEGHTWHHPDGLLYQIVSEGGASLEDPSVPGFKSAMPAFGAKLSRDEIVAVLEYVKNLWVDKEKFGIDIAESQTFMSQENPYPPALN